MRFSGVAEIMEAIAKCQNLKKIGQATFFVQPEGSVTGYFIASIKYNDLPPKVREALDVLNGHFDSCSIQIECDNTEPDRKIKRVKVAKFNF